jgi:hypothetical protein
MYVYLFISVGEFFYFHEIHMIFYVIIYEIVLFFTVIEMRKIILTHTANKRKKRIRVVKLLALTVEKLREAR